MDVLEFMIYSSPLVWVRMLKQSSSINGADSIVGLGSKVVFSLSGILKTGRESSRLES